MERVVETRERELRRKKVLIHRMEEAESASVEERKEWDLCSCANLFKALNLSWGREAIKFCRRIGERGEEPRPMIVGFLREHQKEDLLDKARELKNTPFEEIGIMPDLTQEQRRDEGDMLKEAERRNGNLNAEEKAKNLKWMVVGRKGEKRIIKGIERGGTGRGGMPRGATGHRLPPTTTRGGSWGPAAGAGGGRGQRGRGVVSGARGRGGPRERKELLQYVRGGQRQNRINSKRLRTETEEEEEPYPSQSQELMEATPDAAQ